MFDRSHARTSAAAVHTFLPFAALAVIAVIAAHAKAGPIFSKWVGPPTGNWNVAANWDPAVVPQNGGGDTYVVRIDDSGRQNTTVTHTTGNTTLNGLIIDAGDTLNQNNATSFTITDSVMNDGLWRMNSTNSNTNLQLDGPEVTLSGSGVLLTSNTFSNRIFGVGGVRRLINGIDHTIRGSGQFGVNSSFRFTNHGLIDANQPVAILVQPTGGAGSFNLGTMQASGAGTMRIVAHIDNDGGVIRAVDDGLVRLESGTTIVGGELRTEDNGAMRIQNGTVTLDDVTVNGTLTQLNATNVDLVGGIEVNGQWLMNATNANTNMQLLTDITLGGDAEVLMSNAFSNRIFGTGGVRRLTIPATVPIRGSGQFGVNSNFRFTNHGLIDANQPVAILVQPTGGAGNFNLGTMQASGAGTMRIVAHIDNDGGVIRAVDDGLVLLESGTTIVGGELRTEDNGAMRIQNGTVTLDDVTVNGTLTQLNATNVDLVGGIEVNGQWLMNATNANTNMQLLTDITLDGNIEVLMSNTLANRIYGVGGVRRLTIPAGVPIRGSGQFGVNSNFRFTNHGLIDANQPVEILVQPTGGAGNFNLGTMQASGAGTMRIVAHIDNDGGVIRAVDDGLVRLESGTTILGGELRTEDNGAMRIQSGTVTLDDVTVNGTLTQLNATTVNLIGGVEVNGQWLMNSTGSNTNMQLLTDITLGGDIEVLMSNTLANRIYGIGGVRRLTLDPAATIRGSAHLGVNSNFGLTNHGSIIANQSAGITIDLTDSETFLNTGLLHVTGNGSLTIQPSGMDQQGQVTIDATRTLTRNGHYTQTTAASVTTVNGTLAIAGGGSQLQLQGGTLNGNGQITGAVVNNGGAVAPGASVGHLHLQGSYTQGPAARFVIEIAGETPVNEHDLLTVSSSAVLGGRLSIALMDDFVPNPASEFTILTAGSLDGVFLNAPPDGDDIGVVCFPNGRFDVVYNPTSVVLTNFLSVPLGDLNCDGVVGVADLLLLLAAWGPCADPQDCPADFTGDGAVGVADLLILLASWG